MLKENQLDENIAKWFTIYVRPRTEKKVAEQLEKYNYEVYLPLKKEVRQWKDRLKKVEVPLFNSYVFVKVNTKQYYEIPKLIKGFIKYVTIGGQIIAVREKEIELIRRIIDNTENELGINNEDLSLNDFIEIKTGKLKGIKGRLVEFRGKYRIAVRIESIGANLLLDINKNVVTKI